MANVWHFQEGTFKENIDSASNIARTRTFDMYQNVNTTFLSMIRSNSVEQVFML